MFKKILIGFVFLLIGLSYFYFNQSNKKMNPLSDLNTFHQQLSHALNLAKLDSSSHQIRNYDQEVEFFIDQCQVILSTQKDPYRQIASLQQFFKTAKIKGLKPVFVDLKLSHPYATLKNN